MKSVVCHSKMNINAREFHIHTGSILEKNIVLSEIFERGKFIGSSQIPYQVRDIDNSTSRVEYLRSIAEELHQNMIEEINMLFHIQARIQPLKQYVPHFKLGSIFFHRNILSEAITNYLTTIELKDDYVPAYLYLGKCYLNTADYENAIKILEKGLKLRTAFPDLANTLGVAYTFAKNYGNATLLLQQAIENNPNYDEANFNLGVVLFKSTLSDDDKQEKVVVPSRVIRYMKALMSQERYVDHEWQESFEQVLADINDGNLTDILANLETLQIKLATRIQIDPVIESFYLKFMYGGRELEYDELKTYERRILNQVDTRKDFADYWNEVGTVHMIQCRHLFLKSVAEFEKAVELNNDYSDANNNLSLIRNVKKGFLILLRAILR